MKVLSINNNTVSVSKDTATKQNFKQAQVVFTAKSNIMQPRVQKGVVNIAKRVQGEVINLLNKFTKKPELPFLSGAGVGVVALAALDPVYKQIRDGDANKVESALRSNGIYVSGLARSDAGGYTETTKQYLRSAVDNAESSGKIDSSTAKEIKDLISFTRRREEFETIVPEKISLLDCETDITGTIAEDPVEAALSTIIDEASDTETMSGFGEVLSELPDDDNVLVNAAKYVKEKVLDHVLGILS